MFEYLSIFQGVVERGLIFTGVVVAVYAASRVIRFDNLAVEGAFGLGAAITAYSIKADVNPWSALALSVAMGIASGVVTGFLHTRLKLNHLISGIVVTTGAFSVMLKCAGSNMSLHGKTTIFSCVADVPVGSTLLLAFVMSLLIVGVRWLLATDVGFLLYAVGDNPQMVTNVGKSVACYKTLGLVLSNGCAALSGALFVQYLGYFSIWASVGVLIIGLAGLILAEMVSRGAGLALFVGSLLYQLIIALTFELQIDQDWNKLVTACLIVVLMVMKNSVHTKRDGSKG